ncbi:MAG: tRNA uridine-5-carboxymethylaminomethyl(34) synthesis enzyme MnmG [Planctomycetota bacterium]|nr:MAG: tRNA uridine-5-carboxymethylaminomethyl(34) synthesis enzyme MnmG [Planctomycetota bacterium]
MSQGYEVVVVGAGHAGVEAALAAARMGRRTLLLTANLDTVGKMSCNPAIGGQAKGQIAREVDALGGAMGRAIDAVGIHFKLLNTSKGPAVQAPRAQADRARYAAFLKALCERQPGLTLRQELVSDVLVEDGRARGVVVAGERTYRGEAVVLTCGTFLRGVLHLGAQRSRGGRMGEPPSGLLAALEAHGVRSMRLKTGTPPRVNARSIDTRRMEPQPGDEEPTFFSFLTEEGPQLPQRSCWITRTTPASHRILRENMHRSPLYSGAIEGIGPRYCPSIEDKVVKFPEREAHQVFVEPEGLDTEEVYLNGISTSMPPDVQEALVRSIPGLERAEILRYGYAVEYDAFPPDQLLPTLETRAIPALFFAGQINGTTGYEEAAAQGIVAGINAARHARGEDGVVLERHEAYIGVLIDDLVTRGTDEPYRMFSSRAEHRLLLRHDNADQRLTPLGRSLGLVGDERWERFERKRAALEEGRRAFAARPDKARAMRRQGARLAEVAADMPAVLALPAEVRRALEVELRYAGYIERQEASVLRTRALAETLLPADLPYAELDGLSNEARQKLAARPPRTLGQASRIPGVSPADVSALLVHLKARGVRLRPA